MIHEHRNYFPSFGIGLLLCYLFLSTKKIRKSVTVSVLVFWWVFNCGVLYARSQVWSNDFVKAFHEARYHPFSAMAQFNFGRFLYLAAKQGDENAAIASRDVLTRNISQDQKSISSEALLIIIGNTFSNVPFEEQWVQDAIEKIKVVGYNPVNSRAVSGLLEFIKDFKDEVDPLVVEPLYSYLATHSHPQFVALAGIYYLDFGNRPEFGVDLLSKAENMAGGRVSFRLNLVRGQIKVERIAEACEMFQKVENMPQRVLLLHENNIKELRNYLSERC